MAILPSVDPRVADAAVRLGAGIRRARKNQLMTQSAVAAWAGLNQSTISRIECGKARSIRLENLVRILAVIEAVEVGSPDRHWSRGRITDAMDW